VLPAIPLLFAVVCSSQLRPQISPVFKYPRSRPPPRAPLSIPEHLSGELPQVWRKIILTAREFRSRLPSPAESPPSPPFLDSDFCAALALGRPVPLLCVDKLRRYAWSLIFQKSCFNGHCYLLFFYCECYTPPWRHSLLLLTFRPFSPSVFPTLCEPSPTL